MTREKSAIPLEQDPLTSDERAVLRMLAKAISTSATPVERRKTKILKIGRQYAIGPWVEVKVDLPANRVRTLVDLPTALGRTSDKELNSLVTNLAVLLVDNGWTKQRQLEPPLPP
jgi:hypothetical protein